MMTFDVSVVVLQIHEAGNIFDRGFVRVALIG